ncbi:MAG: hypothetical protein KME07_20075 [Pegethrix bostrychoides GSE-TBD4-15B]|jgi:hypothetical protein|uniref:Uncharacterized protein n=1 Tax=Pegethrix bostrychoides GSE-TBD4-15B TaxID=2839662 RepID=A0A951U6P6_9CYAN|nr:hypothetical protein [Pegethrix bostrychoides GSE-TBD4-15B]
MSKAAPDIQSESVKSELLQQDLVRSSMKNLSGESGFRLFCKAAKLLLRDEKSGLGCAPIKAVPSYV